MYLKSSEFVSNELWYRDENNCYNYIRNLSHRFFIKHEKWKDDILKVIWYYILCFSTSTWTSHIMFARKWPFSDLIWIKLLKWFYTCIYFRLLYVKFNIFHTYLHISSTSFKIWTCIHVSFYKALLFLFNLIFHIGTPQLYTRF